MQIQPTPGLRHEAPILALAFDGLDTLWSGDAAGRLLRWRLGGSDGLTAGLASALASEGDPIAGLALHEGLAWILRPGRLEAFLDEGGPRALVELPVGLHRLASRGGRMVAAGDELAVCLDWSAEQGRWTVGRKVALPSGSTDDLDVSWDGRHFLVVKGRSRLEVYSTETGAKAGGFSQKGLRELGVRFALEPGMAYCGCRGAYNVKLVHWKSGRPKAELRADSAWNCPVEISPDGRFLASLITGNSVELHDLRALEAVFSCEPFYDRSQERLLSGLSKAPAAFRELGPGMVKVSRWRPAPDADMVYTSLALAAGAARIALGGADGRLVLLEPKSCQVLQDAGPAPQPACCRSVLRLRVRASGRRGSELRVLLDPRKQESPEELRAIWKVGPEADSPGGAAPGSRIVKILDSAGFGEAPAKGQGQLAWDEERVYLLEELNLSAYAADTGAALWREPFSCTQICRSSDGRFWTLGQEPGQLDWLEPGPEPRRGSLRIEGVKHWSDMPLPAGNNRLLLRWSEEGGGGGFHVLDVGSGAWTGIGGGLMAWAGADGRHFAICRGSWSDFEVWDGEHPEQGPVLIWKNESFPFRALGCITPVPELGLILAAEGRGLVVWSWDGRVLAHLRGHAAGIWGIVPSADGRGVLTWDYVGIFREWDLSQAVPPAGEAIVLRRGQFEYVSPAAVRAAKEAAERAADPAEAQIHQRLDELWADREALRRYAWSLPDEVPGSVAERLAGRLGDWRPRVVAAEHRVNHWLRLARSKEAWERSAAAWAFGFCHCEGLAGLEILGELLGDESSNVRARAAQSLADMGRWAGFAAEPLARLLEDPSESVGQSTKQALQAIGGAAAKAVAGLLAHKKAAVRQTAAEILAGYGAAAAPALPELIQATRDRRSEKLRVLACGALARMGDAAAEAAPALLERLADKSVDVRVAAARALGRIGASPEAVVPGLIQALNDPDPNVGLAAANGLEKLGPAAAAACPELLEMLERPSTRYASTVAVALLRLGGEPERRAALAWLFKSLAEAPDKYRKMNAIHAMGKFRFAADEVLPELMAALEHEDDWIRAAAVVELGELGRREALPRMISVLLKDPHSSPRDQAAKALGSMGPEALEAVGALAEALRKDEHASVRLAACKSLGKIGGPEAVAALRSMLGAPDWFMSYSACEALASLGEADGQVVAELVRLIEDETVHPSGVVAKLLGSLGEPARSSAGSALRGGLKRHFWKEALEALEALGIREED